MNIGIYSPYFHVLGGGEKYLLSIAEYLSRRNDVTLFASGNIKSQAASAFGIKLDKIHFKSPEVFSMKGIDALIQTKEFDVFFSMTDGSVFLSLAKKNYLIIQSAKHIPPCSFANSVKLTRWKLLCYSEFMKEVIKKEMKKKATILSPGIDIDIFKPPGSKKENIILSIGRFFPYPHNKKHDILVKVFKKHYQSEFYRWKLIISGGLTEEGGREIFENLKKQSLGAPIEIYANVSFDDLTVLYKKAKVYWHAAGFGENLSKFPERAEHFGITTLEAMATGAVPVVFAGGGQKDIIQDGVNGFFWHNEQELVTNTEKIIKNPRLWTSISENAVKKAAHFRPEKFHEKLDALLIEK